MKTAIGRPSIFRGKVHRVLGRLTPEGKREFERHRKELAALSKWKAVDVTDADVLEYMSRGPAASAAYLQKQV